MKRYDKRYKKNPLILAMFNPHGKTSIRRGGRIIPTSSRYYGAERYRVPLGRNIENPLLLTMYNKGHPTRNIAGTRRYGIPRTDTERTTRHYKRYRSTQLPPRGTGLTRGRLRNPPPPSTTVTKYGWDKRKPQTDVERQKMYKKYGPECFLDPQKLAYPVCNKRTGKYDCDGLRAAYARARQQHNNPVAKKAIYIGKNLKCGWALRRHNPGLLIPIATGATTGAGVGVGLTLTKYMIDKFQSKKRNPTKDIIIDEIESLYKLCNRRGLYRSKAEFYNEIGYKSLASMTAKKLMDLRWKLRDKLIKKTKLSRVEIKELMGD